MRNTLFLGAITFALLSVGQADAQDDRWGTTATDGGGLVQGDSTTVTWGFVRDGTGIDPAFGGESSDPSSLISFLDTNIGGGTASDFTDRPWFDLFENIFDRWDSVSGLQFAYEAADSGATINGFSNPQGQLGVNADVRIGGHSIDGQAGSNTLAYNYFPDHGDMVIDTDNVDDFSDPANNFLFLRNVLAHEFGHGMGLPHVTTNASSPEAALMNPFLNENFDGPQIDDIAEAQRRYGDNFEDNAGNDMFSTATDLGNFTGLDIEIGSDADMGSSVIEVAPDQVDFVSIDDDSDEDFLSITLDGTYDMTFVLDMVGPSYTRNGGAYDLSAQSDLDLEILDSDGVTVLGASALNGLNVTEQVDLQLDAGTYFARITGRNNDAQFYTFNASGVFVGVPEPASATFLALGAGALLMRRRRKA
jgi:hypothetical protein